MYRILISLLAFIVAFFCPFIASAQNRIESTGNVGIGTTTPVVKLSVYGPSDDSAAISLQSGTNSRFYIQQGGALLKIGGVTPGVGAINVLNTGRVGIGTASPGYKLDVQNGSVNIGWGANIAYRAGSYVSIGNMSYLNAPYIAFNAFLTTSDIPTSKNLFTPTYNAGGGLVIKGDAGNSGLHFLQRSYNNGIPPYDLSSFTEVLTLTSGGNVGIGTTSTGIHKLAVEGSIGARKVKVNPSGWADFVFHPEYRLSPLEEVEAFIDNNGHLPEIPTAREIAKEGLDLGEMDKKLLQKIEELTLYVIEQNRKLKKQQEHIQRLESELSALKTKAQ
ncbi:TMF family protein [Chitinophaga cymbidii]|uniref:TMF family protein n=1 Tax=Chitinophaga cymbidii TaxID=1096750 RepID=UPI0011BD7B3B